MPAQTVRRPNTLSRFGRTDPTTASSFFSPTSTATEAPVGLAVPVAVDIEGKRRAMEQIRSHSFVSDAQEPIFAEVQQWIEECDREVTLPLTFCGGLVIMRLYRLLTVPSEQTSVWMASVYDAAAAYDFAFLALGHADDEADMTLVRDGSPTRFVTHPNTRAVDGINLLLAGMTAMQEALQAWPCHASGTANAPSTARHPLAVEVMEELMRALREGSFPILLDRAGAGHSFNGAAVSSGLSAIQVDAESLRRVEAFTRHRAHTYFMRATGIATRLAGYTDIEPELMTVLDELFRLWGSMGAATDDLQDVFIDFAAGIHSVCTVMAHLCVAEDAALRPPFRRHLHATLLRDQRDRLAALFGATDAKLDRAALVNFVNEIGLRRALAEYFENQGTLFVATLGEAVHRFGFKAELMIEMTAVVCRDPEFALPKRYLLAFRTIKGARLRRLMNAHAGRYMTHYFLERFWPKG